ncbi:MAG: FAD-dependent oxidoreductase [Sphingobacteriales bacterium]|nr:FAD-dependent oxidoreductase [Sphingobacteriales bacterium]
MKRRDLLRYLSLMMPAAALAPSRLLAAPQTTSSQCCGHFIVIGAGVAGLYAAYRIVQAGGTVTVLEASDRHGGRVRHINGFGNFPVELGAEFVHGNGNQNGNPPSFLYKDINTYNSSWLKSVGQQDTLYTIDNTTVWDSETDDPDILQVWEIIDAVWNYSGPDITVAEYLQNVWNIAPGHRTWHFYETYIGAEHGTSLDQLSMRGYAAQDYLWLTGTNDYVLDAAYLNILDTLYFNNILSNIQYNKQVVAVNYSSDGVVVTDQNGANYVGNAAVVAVPLTILQDGDISFTPALPSNKTAAINGIGMGAGMKIWLKFSSAFWNTAQMFDVLCKSNTTLAWASGKLKTGATNNILNCFIMGERAEYMSAQGSNAINIALAELNSIFGGNVASNNYVDGIIMDWWQEPFIRGAYSYPIAGTYPSSAPPTGTSKRQILAQAVSNKLFFAGEATNNNHPSTVHGALESGARVALEICNAFPANVPASISISGLQNICANNGAIYSIPAVAGTSYNWTVTGGTIVSGQGTHQITVQWNSSTVGTVSVEQTAP